MNADGSNRVVVKYGINDKREIAPVAWRAG